MWSHLTAVPHTVGVSAVACGVRWASGGLYMSGGTSGSSTNPSGVLEVLVVGGATLDISSGPSVVFWRGTMALRSTTVRLLGSTSSLSGPFCVLRI